MTEIKWYDYLGTVAEDGSWAKREDVEALQKELADVRAKAFAAAWVMRDDVTGQELRELREEARGVFMGKDKQVIAKLEDELQNAIAYAQRIQRPPMPGVNAVYGVKAGEEHKLRYTLMITQLHNGSNGGLEIEVQIP